MKSKDSDIIRSVADAALKVMIGEEPDSQEFDQELKKSRLTRTVFAFNMQGFTRV